MSFHHVALATKDVQATHAFYTEAMGFELVKVEPINTESGGWAKHLFYDTGGDGMIAFWDLHDESIGDDWDPSISRGVGLPQWTNHLAWKADDLEDLARRRDRWLACGHDVVEIDHHWCVSIYTRDPNDNLVEFCLSTAAFTAQDRETALAALTSSAPAFSRPPASIESHSPDDD